MLSVEHKSALLVSSIVCVASGGVFFGLDWGSSTDLLKYLRRISCQMTQTLNALAFICVCSAQVFILMRQRFSHLEAPLCLTVSV